MGISAAPEPKRDRDLASLTDRFRPKVVKLFAILRSRLAKSGNYPAVSETWRSRERQQWLYASGRTRPGPIMTEKDGVSTKSNHQSGDAIDILIYRIGHSEEGPLGDRAPEWNLIGEEGAKLGLRWGGAWGDKPHLEWREPDRTPLRR